MESSQADQQLIRRTLLARAIAARDIHVCTHTLAAPPADGPGSGTGDGGIDDARRVGLLHKRYKTMAVLAARIVDGASWDQVAAALGVAPRTARALYGPAEERWRSGDPQPWAPALDGVAGPVVITGAAPIELATEADLAAANAELAEACPCAHGALHAVP